MKLLMLGLIAAGYFTYLNQASQLLNTQFNNYKSFYIQVGQGHGEDLSNHPFVANQ